MRRRWNRMGIRQTIAFSLTIAAALVALLVPLYVNVRLAIDGPEQVTTSTLFETVGPSVVARPETQGAKQVADTQAGPGG